MSLGPIQVVLAVVYLSLAIGVTANIVLTKHDPRAAIGWIGLVWLTPVIGSALYLFLGVNRIRRRAGQMRRERGDPATSRTGSHLALPDPGSGAAADLPVHLHSIASLTRRVTGAPLVAGNMVEPLVNGDEAYPAMLAAIDEAERGVALATYIFDRGQVADRFVDALARAAARGIAVRVLIDGVGARYSRPSIVHTLRAREVDVAQFLPSRFPLPHPYFNLRNHRKLLVADGTTGFCGGMNIRDDHMLSLAPRGATQDVHFRLRGPVVRQLASAFAFDWNFTTHERLEGDAWFPEIAADGPVTARGIPDGPDEDMDALLLTLLGAIAQARRRIVIVTPYFLPDPTLMNALVVAAYRGVDVQILLPERGNLRAVQWAQTSQLGFLLRRGCRIFLTPPPFDHSKLMVVDGEWSLIGSANWDPRSLRLNFEYDVECYCSTLAPTLEALAASKRARAHELTLAEWRARPLAARLRDGLAWLGQPYL